MLPFWLVYLNTRSPVGKIDSTEELFGMVEFVCRALYKLEYVLCKEHLLRTKDTQQEWNPMSQTSLDNNNESVSVLGCAD